MIPLEKKTEACIEIFEMFISKIENILSKDFQYFFEEPTLKETKENAKQILEFAMFRCISSNLQSIVLLLKNDQLRSALTLGRSALETSGKLAYYYMSEQKKKQKIAENYLIHEVFERFNLIRLENKRNDERKANINIENYGWRYTEYKKNKKTYDKILNYSCIGVKNIDILQKIGNSEGSHLDFYSSYRCLSCVSHNSLHSIYFESTFFLSAVFVPLQEVFNHSEKYTFTEDEMEITKRCCPQLK